MRTPVTYVALYYFDDRIDYEVGHVRELVTAAVRDANAHMFRNHKHEDVQLWVRQQAAEQFNETVHEDETITEADVTLTANTARVAGEVIGHYSIRSFT